jgi:hypothetical protein
MCFYNNTMSDYYFEQASKHCLGLNQGMAGFHACARKYKCMKPDELKIKRAVRPIKPPKPKKPKKPKKLTKKYVKEMQDMLDKFGDIGGSGKMRGGCGSCKSGNWIDHVKEYQRKHGCSYKVALSEASKTYHK